jgi:hypothetical protein
MTLRKPNHARHLGLTLRLLRSGNYRVNFRDGNETTAYYTDDLEDAVNTAVEMARKREVANAGAEAELVAQPMILAAMNKCLAQSNESCMEAWATKKYLSGSPTHGLQTARDPADNKENQSAFH